MRYMLVLLLLVAMPATAAETFTPAREHRFTGAAETKARQAKYLEQRLARAVERLDKTCSPSRESLLRNAKGKDLWRARLVAANMARRAATP